MYKIKQNSSELIGEFSGRLKARYNYAQNRDIEESIKEAIYRYFIRHRNQADIDEEEKARIYDSARNILRMKLKSKTSSMFVYTEKETMEYLPLLKKNESLTFRPRVQDVTKVLPGQYKEIFNLYKEGYNLREISLILNKDFEIVQRRWERCRQWFFEKKVELYQA